MSINPYQQYFEGTSKRSTYSRMRATGPREAAFGLALIYASIGASLGIVSGTALAVQIWPVSSTVATTNLAQASASVAGLNGPLIAIPGQPALAMNEASNPSETTALPTPKPVALETKHIGKSTVSRHKLVATKASFENNLQASGGNQPSNSSILSSAAAAIPVSGQVAYQQVAAVAPVFMIEGDATVADFDANTGMVETRDGKSFSIGASATATNVNSWQDYFGHVHYRCDPGGNCTLTRVGVVVPNAKLAI
jgi:hypothetical protein